MDKTALFNLALNAIGARNNVASPTEHSREAEVCSLWYSVVMDQVLSAAPWPELTKLSSLDLLDERDPDVAWVDTNARPGYTFAYALPSDCAQPQYLTNFDRFLITRYTDTQALDTNTEDAILVYTSSAVQPALWSPSLQMAFVYALASHIVIPLSGKTGRAKQLVEQANIFILQARETAANTSMEQFDSIPDWISARGYSGTTLAQRYVYPYGELLVTANA